MVFGPHFPTFYPILDNYLLAKAGIAPDAMARALVRAGVRLAQFRHKGPYTREVFSQAEEVGRILKEGGVRFVINDRADVALMLHADGVHLGQDDLPAASVRGMRGRDMALGLSTHNEAQLRDADRQPADYLAIGPIFGTQSKENPDPVVGLTELARLRPLTQKPLVAIGGITRANARQVLAAGADSVAVISDLFDADLDVRLAEWMKITAGTGSSPEA
jgi:thiamine-phosphate pyrophosphorylase